MNLKVLKKIESNLKETLKSVLTLIESEEQKADDENQTKLPIDRTPSRNELILKMAMNEIGVKEVVGSGNNAKVEEYHRYASKSNNTDQPDSVPWCSSFICWVIEHCIPEYNNPRLKPMGSTNSMMARSWLKWGVSTKKDPLPGDIVVFYRGQKSGWKGHVSFLIRKNADGSLVCLGGNQSDEVNLTTYNDAKLLDIRRSSKARVYDGEDVAVLRTIAHGIINGRYLKDAGKLT